MLFYQKSASYRGWGDLQKKNHQRQFQDWKGKKLTFELVKGYSAEWETSFKRIILKDWELSFFNE